jgi:hypothetical protein
LPTPISINFNGLRFIIRDLLTDCHAVLQTILFVFNDAVGDEYAHGRIPKKRVILGYRKINLERKSGRKINFALQKRQQNKFGTKRRQQNKFCTPAKSIWPQNKFCTPANLAAKSIWNENKPQ